ncbi:MAG: DedA family protein [Cytophagales bacterium]|nr:MAG: DedA family protein [Cytophagales bacterium]
MFKELNDFLEENQKSVYYLFAISVLPLIIDAGVVYLLVQNEKYILSLNSMSWAFIYCIASISMAVGLIHTTFAALVGGFFLGWFSLIYMVPSYLVATLLGYYLGGFIDDGRLMNYFMKGEKSSKIFQNLKRKELLVIFFSRISPVLPFAVMNAVLSMLGANLKRYIPATLAGMLPRTIMFTWLGVEAKSIAEIMHGPKENIYARVLFVVLLMFSSLGLYLLANKALKAGLDKAIDRA